MEFNDILVETGGFGTYQKVLTFGYLSLTLVVISFISWTQIFILLVPPYHLKTFVNGTELITGFNESNVQDTDRCNIIQSGENVTTSSNEVIYDFSLNFPTYASENNLICEDAWKMYFAHTIYWAGSTIGTILFGIINDKYGRRRGFQIAIVLVLISDVATYFCKEYIYFLISRFSSALGGGSIGTTVFIIVTEHSIPSIRRINMFVPSFAFAISSLAIVWLSFLVHEWRYILMITWIPSSIAIIASYFIPESPSWLITKGRVEEAILYIQRMARINKKKISRDLIIHHLQIKEKTEKGQTLKTISQCTEKKDLKNEKRNVLSCYQTFLKVVKSPNLRKRILILSFLWITVCICYNGNNLELQYLPYNMYITYSIAALVEIPGMFFVVLTIDIIGRRWLNASLFIIGGVLGILSANVESKNLMITLLVFMRMCYSSTFDITFNYSNEVVPTEIRGRTVSFVRTCGGIGNAVAPFIVSLAERDALLPLICFGIFAGIAGILMLTMPETCHLHLPQTIEEGENYGKEQSFWSCPFLRSQREKEKDVPKEATNSESFVNPSYEVEDNQVHCVRFHKVTAD